MEIGRTVTAKKAILRALIVLSRSSGSRVARMCCTFVIPTDNSKVGPRKVIYNYEKCNN